MPCLVTGHFLFNFKPILQRIRNKRSFMLPRRQSAFLEKFLSAAAEHFRYCSVKKLFYVIIDKHFTQKPYIYLNMSRYNETDWKD